MGDVRADAKSYLDSIVSKGPITSKFHSADFDRFCAPVAQATDAAGRPREGAPYFQTWQQRLEYNWYPPPPTDPTKKPDKPGSMTCCNAFVGCFGSKMGLPFYVGGFELERTCNQFGRPDGWVESAAGLTPKVGDIIRFNSFHVGVAYEVVPGGSFNHVSAGQGGKGIGYDVLKLVIEKVFYHPGLVQGWIDIDVLKNGKKPEGAPSWLDGYWYIKWQGENYFYWFGAGVAQYVHTRPADLKAPPQNPHDRGRYTVSGNTVTVRWNSTGSVEVFSFNSANRKTMNGNWNNREPLVATKL